MKGFCRLIVTLEKVLVAPARQTPGVRLSFEFSLSWLEQAVPQCMGTPVMKKVMSHSVRRAKLLSHSSCY